MTPERLEEIAELIQEQIAPDSHSQVGRYPHCIELTQAVIELRAFAKVLREQSADAGAGAEEKSATTQPAPVTKLCDQCVFRAAIFPEAGYGICNKCGQERNLYEIPVTTQPAPIECEHKWEREAKSKCEICGIECPHSSTVAFGGKGGMLEYCKACGLADV